MRALGSKKEMAQGAVALFFSVLVGLANVLWITVCSVVRNIINSKRKKDLTKEMVLVTGAGSGIGRLMALEFAKQGARLVLWDINEKSNDAVREEIEAMGREAFSYRVDCSKREEIYAAADKVNIATSSASVHELDYCFLL